MPLPDSEPERELLLLLLPDDEDRPSEAAEPFRPDERAFIPVDWPKVLVSPKPEAPELLPNPPLTSAPKPLLEPLLPNPLLPEEPNPELPLLPRPLLPPRL